MPIRLAPISRRRFLTRSAVAAAGLGITPKLLASIKPTDARSWALLSDPHLAADRATVSRDMNMAEHFAAVTREILERTRLPAGLFINGDCAYNTGETGDYRLLAELLEPIRGAQIPVCLGLGNHDNRERFREALGPELPSSKPLSDKHVALVRTRYVNWFVLDSLEKPLSVPGLLGQPQLDWLASTLDSNRHKPALVLVHHQPDSNGTTSGLKDTDAFYQVIRPRKQVKAYFFGHTHVWKVEQDPSGLHLVNLPAVGYPFRAEQPTGWVLATLGRKGALLELRCTDPKRPAHGQFVELNWRG
jgi:hypothetical protein